MINLKGLNLKETDEKIKIAISKLEKWNNLKLSYGLFLLGDVGTGKTHIIKYLIKELQRIHYYPLCLINEVDMFQNIENYKDQNAHNIGHYKSKAKEANIIFYDDFGTFKPNRLTDQNKIDSVLYSVFDMATSPLIITSNLKWSEFQKATNQRTIDRIMGLIRSEKAETPKDCIIDLFGVPSYRRRGLI